MDEQSLLIFEMIIVAVVTVLSLTWCGYAAWYKLTSKENEGARAFLTACFIFLCLFSTIFEVIWFCKLVGLGV